MIEKDEERYNACTHLVAAEPVEIVRQYSVVFVRRRREVHFGVPAAQLDGGFVVGMRRILDMPERAQMQL